MATITAATALLPLLELPEWLDGTGGWDELLDEPVELDPLAGWAPLGGLDVPVELLWTDAPVWPGEEVPLAAPGIAMAGRAAGGPGADVVVLEQALDAVLAGGAGSGSPVRTRALLVAAERARAAALVELAEMDATGAHSGPGERGSTGAWLRDSMVITDAAARAEVALAVRLRDHLPAVGAALAAGTLTAGHARAISSGVRGLDPATVRDATDGLLALAAVCSPAETARRLRESAHAVDERLGEQARRRAEHRQGFTAEQVGEQTALGGTLSGLAGDLLRLALDTALRVDTEQAAQHAERSGENTELDRRSRAARQADVLTGWAADYLAGQASGTSLAQDCTTVRTHLHVSCTPTDLDRATLPALAGLGTVPGLRPGWTPGLRPRDLPDTPDTSCPTIPRCPTGPAPAPTLAGLLARQLAGDPSVRGPQLTGGSLLSSALLRELCCDTTFTTHLLTGHPGSPLTDPAGVSLDPLYLGTSSRTVSAHQLKALIARDRTCVVRGCHRPPARCIAHHVQHWLDNGPTDLDNLVLLCEQHHHQHHSQGRTLNHRDGRQMTQAGWNHAPP